jgi:gamma-glutamyl-gamma-aminobutyrate hydrolase PuuD
MIYMRARVLLPFRHPKKLPAYEAALRAADLEPVSVTVTEPVSFDNTAGLLLMGGTDVNPARYGQVAVPETDEPDDRRDEVELALIDEALEKDLPILAICRGIQILNVYHGGTLIQHLPPAAGHDPEKPAASAIAHDVLIEPNTLMAAVAETRCWGVNSRHHQAIDRVGEKLRPSAHAANDSVIEALERPDKRFVLAVQWHPEDQIKHYPDQLKLFQSFANAITE